MSQLGVGAMLHLLFGGSENDPTSYAGQTIIDAVLENNKLRLTLFPADKIITIFDNGQSCCEERWMSTDDNVQSLIGGKLIHIMTKNGPEVENDWGGEHEQVFIEIATDKGLITLVNHNEHNGYYGGFGLTIIEEDVEKSTT